MRLLLAAVTAVLLVAACGGDDPKTSCAVSVAGQHATVALSTKVGASAVAELGAYTVAFSVLDGSKLQAEVRDASSSLATMTAGDVSGKVGGSAPTKDGVLDFSCAP